MEKNHKKTVLLVEDKAIITIAETNLLKKNGYDVVVAYNGNEAVKIAKDNPSIDLILMDIDLGKGIDGAEAAQIILQDRMIPIIFLSNHAEKEIVEKTEKITSYGYVLKNSGETVLLTSIKMAFRLFEAQTEKKLSEQKYLESDLKFHILEKEIDDVIWTMDINFQLTYISPSVEKMYGYSVDDMMKLNLQDYLTPQSVNKTINVLADEISSFLTKKAEKKITTLVLEQIKKDGTIFTTEIRSRFLLDHDKNPTGMIGVTRDISERLKSAAALEESSKNLNLALEGAQVGLWSQDFLSGKVLRSENWAKMLGYKLDEIEDSLNFWISIIHPEDLESVLETARKHDEGLTPFFKVQHRLKCKNGDYKWILNWGRVSERDKNGKALKANGIHLDIDDKIKAESDRKKSEIKIQSIIQAAPIGIGVTKNRILQEVNGTFCKMLGYKPEELLGNSARILYTNDEDYDFVGVEKYKQIEEYGTGTVETKWKTKDGRVIDILLSSTPLNLQDISGGVTFTALDITDRKVSEQLLKKALSEKVALHRELLHRIKNSLNLIKSLVFLERDKVIDKNTSKILENLEMRISTLSHLYSLLNESGISQVIDLGEYLNQITESLKKSYFDENKKIIIKSNFSKVSVSPKTASAVGLIVNEILTNSLKYAFPKSLKGNVSLIMKESDGKVDIEISDDGIGASDILNIEESKGLGLQLVNMLVQQLSGTLKLETQGGTKFKIIFPLSD
jgi:PAS domain S-box-containing protein